MGKPVTSLDTQLYNLIMADIAVATIIRLLIHGN